MKLLESTEPARAGERRERRGFTLIELSIALSILLIAVVAVVSATSNMHGMRKFNRERAVANNGLRSMAERIHARSTELRRSSPATWAAAFDETYEPGGTFGDTFDVVGLNLDTGAASMGTIRVVTDETLSDDDLGVQLGMPRDLNGDGDAADTDVTADASILPVVLALRWRGQRGSIELDHGFYVAGY